MSLVIVRKYLLVSLLVLLYFSRVEAQTSPPPADSIPAPEAVVKKAVQLKSLKPEAWVGDYIRVEVSNLATLVKAQEEYQKPLVLYLNGIPMRGINAEFVSVKEGSMLFRLTRDTFSMPAWNVFYQSERFKVSRRMSVSVGFENDISINTEVKNFTLHLVQVPMLLVSIGSILLVVGLFVLLARKTAIIRDNNSGTNNGYYSLSKSQLAFWTFVVVSSFVYIWVVTGEAVPVTGSTLILLAISSSTTAGASVIDSSKTGLVSAGLNGGSEGFLKDILSDYNGISIHRFQMVLWTIVFGIFFLQKVISNLAMPQFDDSLLILMGISNVTYLGLKIPEKNEIKVSPQNTSSEPDIPYYGNSTKEDNEVPPVG